MHFEKIQLFIHENKQKFLFVLVGGIAFFGLLAGWQAWSTFQENKAVASYVGAEGNSSKLEAVIHDFGGSKVALLAQVDLAILAQEEKNWSLCQERFERLYNAAKRKIFFRVFALHGIGYCQREEGKFAEAALTFERAAKEPGHVNPAVSRLEAARSLDLGKDPKAEEAYTKLLEEKELSPELKAQIEEKLKWLREQKKS